MNYIFIDTFALHALTRDHAAALKAFLLREQLTPVLSSLQLMEYYNPLRAAGDRTQHAMQFFMEVPFVIVNQDAIYALEEEAYPGRAAHLPVALDAGPLLAGLHPGQRWELLLKIFHEGIPEANFHLPDWAAAYRAQQDWPGHAAFILEHARRTGAIGTKAAMLQSLDLRLCEGMSGIMDKAAGPGHRDAVFYSNLSKLQHLLQYEDTYRMKGIHLTSLIFWYDYVVAGKPARPSDQADIYYALIYPYCHTVIVDKSRLDGLEKIQRSEGLYRDIHFYNQKTFLEKLSHYVAAGIPKTGEI